MIEIKNLCKTFHTVDNTVEALNNINLTIADGDIYGIIGMSGAGKSTLVRCINLLERPTSGSIIIDGIDMTSLSNKELREQRHSITMIFQGFNLLMQRNVIDNVCFPLELSGVKKSDAEKKAYELLEIVGLKDKAKAYPSQLSGGQQQRVAIARALTTNPKVLLCDEATSALDPNTTKSILELIQDINKKYGITVVIITHQMSVVESICKHVAVIDSGIIQESGEVCEVFTHPKSLAAKKLVFPEGSTDDNIVISQTGERFIRVVFNGASATGKPLIAHMAVEKGIEASISYASTKSIGNKTFGSMLLGINGNDDVIKEAIAYMSQSPEILAEEVKINVG